MSQPATALPPEELVIRMDDGVPVLQLLDHVSFDVLRAWLRERVPARLDAIGGRTSRLDLGDRALELFDLRRVVHLLDDEFGVAVSGIYAADDAVRRFTERELKLKLFAHPVAAPDGDAPDALDADDEPVDDEPTAEAAPVADVVVDAEDDPSDDDDEVLPSIAPREPGERRTLTIRRTLRSGTIVRFDGDLVVFGDVNPGAHVVATGNIVVLGALHGMAHAGASGDTDAFLLALAFHPTQLRLASTIALPPERPSSRAIAPEIAVLRDGAIVIRPYKGRLPS